MIIEGVEAEGIFSFGAGDEGLSVDLNEVLTVIVGPNASGKTNLIRILDVVRTVVRFQDPKQENRGALAGRLDRFVSVALRGTAWAPEAARVRVRVAFTRPDEQAMLAAFIRAVVFAALLDGQVPDDRTIADLEAWVASEVTTDKLASLFRGAILVSHTGVLGTPWRLAYEFTHRETPFIWHLATAWPNRADVIEPQRHVSMELTSFPSLAQRVFGVGWGSQSGLPRPPERSLMLDTLLTAGDDAVKVQMRSPSVTHLPAPWREFAALARPLISDEYLSPLQPVIVLASVLSVLLARGLSYLGLLTFPGVDSPPGRASV